MTTDTSGPRALWLIRIRDFCAHAASVEGAHTSSTGLLLAVMLTAWAALLEP